MKPNLSKIIKQTELVFDLAPESIKLGDRRVEFVKARQIYWLVATYFGYGVSEVASAIGMSHSTAYHSIEKALISCLHDKDVRTNVYNLIQTLKQHENSTPKVPAGNALFRVAVDAIL